MRNLSQIVDIFQFQVRSEIRFPDVGDQSLKFDPMMYLPLPVPKPPHIINLTVLPLGYPEVAPMKCRVQIAKDKLFKDLERRLSEDLPIEEGICLEPPRRFVFGKVYTNHRIYAIFSGDDPISDVQSYDPIWAFEVAEPPVTPATEADGEVSAAAGSSEPVPEAGQGFDGQCDGSEQSNAAGQGSEAQPPMPPPVAHVAVQLRKSTRAGAFSTFAPSLLFAYRRDVTTTEELTKRVMLSATRLKDFFGLPDLQVTLTVAGTYDSQEGAPLNEEGFFSEQQPQQPVSELS